MKILIAILSLAFLTILSAQDLEDNNSKTLDRANQFLEEKRFEESQSEINRLRSVNYSNPELDLLQSKVWIEQANKLYNQRKFKSAFELYSKAYESWTAHPLVQQRYFELKGKKLTDEILIKKKILPVEEKPVLDEYPKENLTERNLELTLLKFEKNYQLLFGILFGMIGSLIIVLIGGTIILWKLFKKF